MKLVTFEVRTPLGRQRRLGALLDGHQDGRIADVTLAYAAYLREETDEPTPDELAQLRTPPDMIGWLRGEHRSREAAEQALRYASARLAKGDAHGPQGEQLVFQRSEIRLLAPLPRPNTFRDFSVFEEHGTHPEDGSMRRKAPHWYRWPPYYKASPESIYGPEDSIPYVYYTRKLDLEP
ncbi:MAG TPA: fumarylacetoacetate hydrolase family protein, partial [Chloroflexota bacterium]|nr:fumarylacetoacetate hydrolase family protein [Chloroflexota bacterium]